METKKPLHAPYLPKSVSYHGSYYKGNNYCAASRACHTDGTGMQKAQGTATCTIELIDRTNLANQL